MKTIMVATDFSEAAMSACRYAAALGEKAGARVSLFNAIEPVATPAETLVTLNPADFKESAMRNMRTVAEELDSNHTNMLYTECKEGVAAPSIIRNCRKEKADLIVVGMKMKYKGLRKVLGSTITALIPRSPVPVLVVPEAAIFKGIKTIAVAVEKDTEAAEASHVIGMVKDLAEKFGSTTYVVTIRENNSEHDHDKPATYLKLLHSINPLFKSIGSDNVVESLLQFVENYDVDLLAAMPQKTTWLEKLFTQSTTKQLVYNAHVPVLVMPAKKKSS